MTFKPISSLDVFTSNVNSWFKIVGKNEINDEIWMAWAALRILHVSDSAGIADIFGLSKSFSACAKRLWRC